MKGRLEVAVIIRASRRAVEGSLCLCVPRTGGTGGARDGGGGLGEGGPEAKGWSVSTKARTCIRA